MMPPARYSIDTVAVLVIGVLALYPLSESYGGSRWLVAACAGLGLGLGVSGLGKALGLSVWATVLTAFTGYFLVGTIVLFADQAPGGMVPVPAVLRLLAAGAVDGWRDMLTASTPIDVGGTLLIVPFLAAYIASLIAGHLLWRSRWPSGAIVAVVMLFVVGCAFGERETPMTALRGLTLAVATAIWLRWRDLPTGRIDWTRRVLSALAVVLVASAATWAFAAATDEGDRRVLRDYVEPPFDPTEFASPLSAFRSFRTDRGTDVVLEVNGLEGGRGASGRDLDPRITLATMDYFDGNVWNVAGGAGAVSESGRFEDLEPKGESTSAVTFAYREFSGIWVPVAGDYSAIQTPHDWSRLIHNPATGTVVHTGGSGSGDTITVSTDLSDYLDRDTIERADAGGSTVPQPAVGLDSLRDFAARVVADAGASTAGGQALALEAAFREGYFSDGTESVSSASGHGLRRLMDLMESEFMVGNEEQYASAMGLAAQQLGLPARVVLGFRPKERAAGFANGEVVGKDVSAWVEIDLERLGWVPFDPTPDENRTQERRNDEPEPEPQPHVLQPPRIPTEPDRNTDDFSRGSVGPTTGIGSRIAAFLIALVKPVGITLSVFAIPAMILFAKSLRRRRRRYADTPVLRVSGGWQEITDTAKDLGSAMPAGRSRTQVATSLKRRFPDSDVDDLARLTDAYVFGPGQPTHEQSSAHWQRANAAVKSMRDSVPWYRRWWSRISLASFDMSRTLRRWGRALAFWR